MLQISDSCLTLVFPTMLQVVGQVINTITVSSYGFLFNFRMVGQASDTITTLTYRFYWCGDVCCLSLTGPTVFQPEGFSSSDYL